MRTVLYFLRVGTETDVIALLGETFPAGQGPSWIAYVDDDPCLYIHLYRHHETEFEPEDFEKLTRMFGGIPITVSADVSGRHEGDREVRDLASLLLGRFGGMASDGYTSHLWTLEEIHSDALVEDHPFFDYRGWYVSPFVPT